MGRERKHIYNALQSTFLVPASKLADGKQSPDFASYHGIKKISKQAWHKKLITALVFQVATSGSLPNFAGWSRMSHRINTPPRPALSKALHSCTFSLQPHTALPRMLQALWHWQALASTCSLPDAPWCPPGCGTGELWESHQAALPQTAHFLVPCRPGWSRPGRARASQQAGGEGAAQSHGRSKLEPVSYAPRSTANATLCFRHGNDAKEKEPQAVK